MGLITEVTSILRTAFSPPDKIELEDDDGIVGSVVSSRFEGMEMIDRINLIWDLLDENLPREKRRRVILIVAATPEEGDRVLSLSENRITVS